MRKKFKFLLLILTISFVYLTISIRAQNSVKQDTIKKDKITKNKEGKLFQESDILINNQTYYVPERGTIEISLQHSFGSTENGSKDWWGMNSGANTRLSIAYVPVQNLILSAASTEVNASGLQR